MEVRSWKLEVRGWMLDVRKQIKKCRDGVGACIARPPIEEIAQINPAKPSKKAPLTRGLAPEWATGGSSGITLVALVITIVVLLILAGVTINLTIGERGIFTTAQRAAQNYKDAQEQELQELANFENLMNNTINALGNNTELGVKEIPVTKVELSGEKTTIDTESTLQLTKLVLPENATNKDVTWSSANEEIAVVDQNGLVRGVTEGNTRILATTNNGVIGSYEITIEKFKLYLYNYGNECESVTGGIRVDMNMDYEGGPSYNEYVKKNIDHIEINKISYVINIGCITTNVIDVSNYSKLYVLKQFTEKANEGYRGSSVRLTVSPFACVDGTVEGGKTFYNFSGERFEYSKEVYDMVPLNEDLIIETDISDFSGSYYIRAYADRTGEKVYKIWMEK